MKALKITLAIVAVTILTVSGVKSENTILDNQEVNKQTTKTDLLAHGKDKIEKPRNG